MLKWVIFAKEQGFEADHPSAMDLAKFVDSLKKLRSASISATLSGLSTVWAMLGLELP